MSLCRLSELGFIWLTNGNTCLKERHLSCQKVSLNTVFYVIPTPSEIQNIFRHNVLPKQSLTSNASTSIEENLPNKVNPDIKLFRPLKSEINVMSNQDNKRYNIITGTTSHLINAIPSNNPELIELEMKRKKFTKTSLYIRNQPCIHVTEKVRRSVLDPITPLNINTLADSVL